MLRPRPRPKAQVAGAGTGILPGGLREAERGLVAGEVGDELGVFEGECDAAGGFGEAVEDTAEVGVFGEAEGEALTDLALAEVTVEGLGILTIFVFVLPLAGGSDENRVERFFRFSSSCGSTTPLGRGVPNRLDL